MKLSHATSGTLVANQKQLPRCLLQAVWTTRLEFNKACHRGYVNKGKGLAYPYA